MVGDTCQGSGMSGLQEKCPHPTYECGDISMHSPDRTLWAEEAGIVTNCYLLHPIRSAIWGPRDNLSKSISDHLLHEVKVTQLLKSGESSFENIKCITK
jgi:hypothetical protein